MNRDAVKTEIKDIFHHVAPDIEFDELDLARPLNEQVEMDSIDFYRLLIQIDERMKVNVPDSMLHELKNLNGLIDYVVANSQ